MTDDQTFQGGNIHRKKVNTDLWNETIRENGFFLFC